MEITVPSGSDFGGIQHLGHSDPKVTMRYAHLSSKQLQEAASAASVIVKKQEAVPQAERQAA